MCSLYQQAPALHQRGVHLMCCDEKTGMQAKAAGSSYPTARARIRRASESLVRLVADLCDVEEDLGKKDRRGILRSTASRAAFLADPRHRIRFVYTPKHASWLNQIELWFSILVRRLLKRASFASVDQLKERVLAFIEYFNRTLAKPFKWTYTGRALVA